MGCSAAATVFMFQSHSCIVLERRIRRAWILFFKRSAFLRRSTLFLQLLLWFLSTPGSLLPIPWPVHRFHRGETAHRKVILARIVAPVSKPEHPFKVCVCVCDSIQYSWRETIIYLNITWTDIKNVNSRCNCGPNCFETMSSKKYHLIGQVWRMDRRRLVVVWELP